ncbi:MAG: hypothetical protein ACRD3E_11585 [Terriglobales bacterium]
MMPKADYKKPNSKKRLRELYQEQINALPAGDPQRTRLITLLARLDGHDTRAKATDYPNRSHGKKQQPAPDGCAWWQSLTDEQRDVQRMTWAAEVLTNGGTQRANLSGFGGDITADELERARAIRSGELQPVAYLLEFIPCGQYERAEDKEQADELIAAHRQTCTQCSADHHFDVCGVTCDGIYPEHQGQPS